MVTTDRGRACGGVRVLLCGSRKRP
ncbi:hypothetical protein DV706_18430 (plasmid) [Natronorubrum bangense]|uniref:Uncharacterized protein n=1 Tax=Natronorubrum bangense TaxID=61858 RepID=A0A4D6HSJ3_9EURY|nr:hypothetical protein DV706_18430 [Natronorubrum bangense]